MSGAGDWAGARSQLQALVGQRQWSGARALVRDTDILRYCEAVGIPPPPRDADGGMTAPPLFLPPFAIGGEVGPDGRRHRPGEVVIDHPALRRRLMGGCAITFVAPIRAGDEIEVDPVFESVVQKESRNGPMLLVTTANVYRGVDGGERRVERWTIVHR